MDQLLGNRRIFIVEDSVTNMAVFNMLLRDSGATIIQDFMNADTVNLLTNHLPIDIIIMDLTLRNGITGYELLRRVKAEAHLAAIPAIAVSGADPLAEIPRAQGEGFAGFIRKPIEPMLFAQQIADCLSGKPVWISEIVQLDNIVWPTRR